MPPTDSAWWNSYDESAVWNVRLALPGKAKGDRMEPRVMAHSQTHRLRERMVEAQIQHGQEVRADLPGIRISAEAERRRGTAEPQRGVIFFCTMGEIKIREVIASGDAEPLPTEVLLEGLEVPAPGVYDILNALVHSNGALRLRVDSATQIVSRASEFNHGWL
jgi:hypothetical protein